MSWLGLDIGGANLKASDGRCWALSAPFALWRDPGGLTDAVTALVSQSPAFECLAVTMTGELCDCYRNKAEGVRRILAAVEQAAGGRPVRVYLVDGKFAAISEALERPHLAAASNWHALARFAGRFVETSAALLVDIGSTTTDLVPLIDGRPCTAALTDTERLMARQLVYTGIGRTPMCVVVPALPWRGSHCPAAAELFATTADAYVFLEDIPEQLDAAWTADRRPLTKEFARERMARMVCADASTFSNDDAEIAAKWVRESQLVQLNAALAEVVSTMPQPPEAWVVSGSGEFLACRLAGVPRIISLESELGPDISSAAAAFSVARLAAEFATN